VVNGHPDFDLQAHSIHSDGQLPAGDVVRRAAAAGARLFALSDHDTVDGVEEALAAGRETGIRVVPATEISSLDEDGRDLHLLGYCFDQRDAALEHALAEFRADRERRAERMAQGLRDAGLKLDEALLERRREAGKPIGRPHLAAAVIDHPDNATRLAAEGLDDAGAILAAYLTPEAPAFVPRTMPTIAEAIAVIHAAGGVAVWAHPFWDLHVRGEVLHLVDRFRALGLDGVEVFYPTHTHDQAQVLHAHCAAAGLLMTGSSDFHGPTSRHGDRFLAFELYGLEPALGPIAG
jgi:predicted metal-dependent phosphoesterase TrpH